MKDTAVIDGVTITREQATKALAEMDAITLAPASGSFYIPLSNGRSVCIEKLYSNPTRLYLESVPDYDWAVERTGFANTSSLFLRRRT